MGSGPPTRQAAQSGQARLGERLALLQKNGIIPETLPQESESFLEAILPAYFSDPKFDIPAEIRESSFNQEVYQQTESALGNWDFSQEVSKLTHPVLLFWGKDDPFGMPMAEAVKDSLSSAQVTFVILESCGHYWQECPDTFFSRIRAFLKLNGS
jgi:pimeloyl-ACP methyl ester carboxylesterase